MYLSDLQLVPYMYDDFKNILWGSFIKKKDINITLSITTSNRLDLFNRTINSFHKNCNDNHLIKKIFHFDDSSSHFDLMEMNNTLKKNIRYLQGDHCVLYVLYVLYSQNFVLYGTI